MKKFSRFFVLGAVASFLALPLFAGRHAEGAYVVINGKDMGFEVVSANEGTSAQVGEYKSGGGVADVVRIRRSNAGGGWETVSVKIKSKRGGGAKFFFSGSQSALGGKCASSVCDYDDLKINGKLVKNGDFSAGARGWVLPHQYPARIAEEKLASGSKNFYLRTDTYAGCDISLEAGKVCEISFKYRRAGVLEFTRGTLPLDISRFANLNAGDFSKWGCNYNLGGLDFSRRDFGGMDFSLVDPAKNGGKNAVAFSSKSDRAGAEKISFDLPEVYRGKYLYLLHTGFFCRDNYDKVAKLKFVSAGGEVLERTLKRREDTWLFTDPRVINANMRAVYTALPKEGKGSLFLSRFDLPGDGTVKRLELETLHGDTFVLLGATLSDKQVETVNLEEFDSENWVAIDSPDDIYIKKGSALDQSGFFDPAPAGAYGRVILSGRGTLAFEKTPEKDARFKGFSEYSLPYFLKLEKSRRAREIKRYAESFKTTGYNFARISFEILREHMSDAEREELYDTADMLVSELKRNGVYIHLTLAWYRIGLKEYSFFLRDDVKLRAVFGDPNVRAHWKKSVEFILEHRNPYTGMKWKDDPVFACVEYYNELAICFSRMDESSKFHPQDTVTPETRALVLSKWRAWLKRRYGGDISKLNASWSKMLSFMKTKFDYKSFDEVPCIVRGNSDYLRCCWDNLEDFVRFAEKVVDETGYKGLRTQNNLGPVSIGTAVRSRTSDYVIANTYFSHPTSFSMGNASCGQEDAIRTLASYWRGAASMKINNRAFFVTEYNHCFWNKSRFEMPAMFAPYSAFQNFSGLTIHADAVPYENRQKAVSPFAVFFSPVARASEFVATAAFIRGDVSPSRHRVDMKISPQYLAENDNATRALNGSQTRVLLLSGFANAFEGGVPEAVKKVSPKKADMEMSPQGSSSVVAEAWFHSVVDGKSGDFDMEKFVEKMREKGILSPDNITDVAKGIYQTDTEEIALDSKNLWLKIRTPRTEIAAMNAPKKTRLGALKIISCDGPATIGAVSLDGADLSESSRIMLLFVTRESNTGMKLTSDGVMSRGGGKLPVLMRKAKMSASLSLSPGARYEVYPLALNGERREKLPVKFKNGAVKISIDNSKLPNGATPFFEIVKVK